MLLHLPEHIPDDRSARIFGNGILAQDPVIVNLWELQATFFKLDPLALKVGKFSVTARHRIG
jgi:hypothetical protein